MELDGVVIDCIDPIALADFYCRLLNWKRWEQKGDEVSVIQSPKTGIKLLFQKNEYYVPPVWPEEAHTQGQQEHLDFIVQDQTELKEAVSHAVRCGARIADAQYGHNEEKNTDKWITLIDPEGHPFCFVIWW
ncbi:MAG: VOC family protein [Lachnospiraceae bacterium]|nr:VOC family protein [Lachnospiraceae bacterium]